MSVPLFLELVSFGAVVISCGFIVDRLAYEQTHLGQEFLWSALLSCFSFVSVSNVLVTSIVILRKLFPHDQETVKWITIVNVSVSVVLSLLFSTILIVELLSSTLDMYPSDRKSVLLSVTLIQMAYGAMLLQSHLQ